MMARLVGAKNRQYWYRACVRYNFQPPGFSVVCHHGLLYIYIYIDLSGWKYLRGSFRPSRLLAIFMTIIVANIVKLLS